MQWTTLTLAIALCHGALAKPTNELLANGRGISPVAGNEPWQLGSSTLKRMMSLPKQTLQDAFVSREDIEKGEPKQLPTVNLKDICQVVRFPTAGAEPEEQCALQAPAPFSTLGDQVDQRVCVELTVDESAQNLCDSPQPEDQVTVVVIDNEATSDAHSNVKALDGPRSMQTLAEILQNLDPRLLNDMLMGMRSVVFCAQHFMENVRELQNGHPIRAFFGNIKCVLPLSVDVYMFLTHLPESSRVRQATERHLDSVLETVIGDV